MDLSISILKIAISMFLVSAAYIVLLAVLAKFVQPIRLLLADEGRIILNNANSSSQNRHQAIFYLSNAYSPWPTVIASLSFPIAAIFIAFSICRIQITKREPRKSGGARMAGLFTISVIAANPVFGLVLFLEHFFLTILLIVMTGQIEAFRVVVEKLAELEDRIWSMKFHHGRLGWR